MAAALQNVREGMNVREAARLYNLPFETLRRRVVEKVPLECRSGPPTVLTQLEEDELAPYCVKMADMGFGLSRSDVMAVAFKIAEASGRIHPFTDASGSWGCGAFLDWGEAWFQWEWSPAAAQKQIAVKELYPVLILKAFNYAH